MECPRTSRIYSKSVQPQIVGGISHQNSLAPFSLQLHVKVLGLTPDKRYLIVSNTAISRLGLPDVRGPPLL